MKPFTTEDIQFILQLIKEAGDKALQYQKGPIAVQRKLDASIVTDADVAVQQFLISSLADYFSKKSQKINFIYEENFEGTETDLTEETISIIIDPIDGTAIFSMGLPVWCISIGVFFGETPQYGFVFAPAADMLFHNDDTYAYFNNEIISVDSRMHIDNESNIFYASEIQKIYYIDFPGKSRNLGSTALQASLVANNQKTRALAFIGSSCIWDWAGALPILLKAGAKIKYINGEEFNIHRVIENDYYLPEYLIAYTVDDFSYIQSIFKDHQDIR